MEAMSLSECPSIVTCIMSDGAAYTTEVFTMDAAEHSNMNHVKAERSFHLLVDNGLLYDDLRHVNMKPVTSDDCIYITDHAFDRMKERAGWGRSASSRMAGKVYDKGTPVYPTTAHLKKWFDQKKIIYKGQLRRQKFLLYGDYLFVFHDNILITMYPFDIKNLFNKDTRSYRHKKKNICRYAG